MIQFKRLSPQEEREARYLALLALSAHRRPPTGSANPVPEKGLRDVDEFQWQQLSDTQRQKLYAYWDENPEAFSAHLEHFRSASPEIIGNSSLSSKTRALLGTLAELLTLPRAAAGLTATALLIVSLALLLPGIGPTLETRLNAGYEHLNSSHRLVITLPWQHESGTIGFAASNNTSPLSQAFAVGLMTGQARINDSRSDLPVESPVLSRLTNRYVTNPAEKLASHVGQWNVLLSAAAKEPNAVDPDFWSQQLEIATTFRKQWQQSDAFYPLVAGHMDRVSSLIESLDSGQSTARASRELLTELTLFREQLGPRNNQFLEEQ